MADFFLGRALTTTAAPQPGADLYEAAHGL